MIYTFAVVLSLSNPIGLAPIDPAVPTTAIPEVTVNDNRRTAGKISGKTYTLALEIVEAAWRPIPDGAAAPILAFQEVGKVPLIPGPLIRVALGTRILVSVTNRDTVTRVVRGLSGRRQAELDSLLIEPGATETAEFLADADGTFFYWASRPGVDIGDRLYHDSQLNGALVVDPAATSGTAPDRVMIISGWVQRPLPDGEPDLNTEIFTINGRPWPHTERFSYEVGDSIHWRWINASAAPHPLHLHGFYFRVDARGTTSRDTVYWASQRRMAVTERVLAGETARITFSPNRPGGWIFHCHLNWHVVSNSGIGTEILPDSERLQQILAGHPHNDPDHHVERAMGGLMLAMQVNTPRGWTPLTGQRRLLHINVVSDSAPDAPHTLFRYVSDEESHLERLPTVSSTLVLHRGEPTTIRVHNRTAQPTAVHWHGVELESPFDGVVGVGGYPTSPTPAIMPGDSFDVRITAPRAGSFMYHTHLNDILQHSRGLWGALVIVDPNEGYDPEYDKVFQVGEGVDFEPILNGTATPATQELKAESTYRFRLMNISMGGPNLRYQLVKDGAPYRWQPLAKDGFDLPAWQRHEAASSQIVSIGETYDFAVKLPAGKYALELRKADQTLVSRVPIRVLAWQDPDVQVRSAVLPLPEPLRAGARVLGYRQAGTSLVELRAGTNGMTCLADDPALPPFHVACYHESMEPFMARGRELRANGVTGDQVDTVRYREVSEGKLAIPEQPAALWQLSGGPGSYDAVTNSIKEARSLYVVYIPFATTATTGIPSIPSAGQPWLMFPGTPKAHIMFVPRM